MREALCVYWCRLSGSCKHVSDVTLEPFSVLGTLAEQVYVEYDLPIEQFYCFDPEVLGVFIGKFAELLPTRSDLVGHAVAQVTVRHDRTGRVPDPTPPAFRPRGIHP